MTYKGQKPRYPRFKKKGHGESFRSPHGLKVEERATLRAIPAVNSSRRAGSILDEWYKVAEMLPRDREEAQREWLSKQKDRNLNSFLEKLNRWVRRFHSIL